MNRSRSRQASSSKSLELIATGAPFEPLFVGLFAPLPILETRERAREDRVPGGAALFSRLAHQPDDYDLHIDTSALTPREAARTILAYAASAQRRAFRSLHALTKGR